jgi:hypothetical protein
MYGAAPASAHHDTTCYTPVNPAWECVTGFALTSAATGRYVSVQSDGTLAANGTHHGWYQHIEYLRMNDWHDNWPEGEWLGMLFSQSAKIASSSGNGGVIRADAGWIGWGQAFRLVFLDYDDVGAYYGIQHLESGKWLTAHSDGRLRADSTFIGWHQAFRYEN